MEMKNELEMNSGNELEMNSVVEFAVKFRKESITGFLDLENVDDERPLQFYTDGGTSWYVPSNPNGGQITNI